MKNIEILQDGEVINVILADEEFAEAMHPGAWRVAAIQPEPPAPPVPQVCTAAQGERALFDLRGITDDDVLAAIDQIQDADNRYRARSAYQRATEWRRDSETTQTLAAILALSESDMDALFAYAVTVRV